MATATLAQPNFFVWGAWRSRVVKEPFLTRKVAEPVKKIVLGENIMIALTDEGKVVSWGKDENSGCLGLGDITRRDMPAEVFLGSKENQEVVVDIQMGRDHVVALTKDGEVYCWGDGSRGQLGNGSFNNHFKPKRVVRGPLQDKQIKQIAVVKNSTFALATTGEVYAWGDNEDNVLGLEDPSIPHEAEPVHLSLLGEMRVRRLEIYENRTVIAHVRPEEEDDDDGMGVDAERRESEVEEHREQVDVERVGVETRRILEQTQEWYKHILKVKHGHPYEEVMPDTPQHLKDSHHTVHDDYRVELAQLDKAERHLGALVGVALGELELVKKRPGLGNIRLILCIFTDMCKLRKEKVQHLIGARRLSDAVKSTQSISRYAVTDFGANANDEIRKIIAVSKELQDVLGVVNKITVSDGPTRDLKVALREAIECKLQLHDTRVELLKAAEGKRFDAMMPALRIIMDRWTHLKNFSLYALYAEAESKDMKWESDDRYLEHLVQESNKQIDQMLDIDKDQIISHDTSVPSLCYELLRENAQLRKMSNSYQLHVLLLYKGRNPSGAVVGIKPHGESGRHGPG